MAKTYGRGAKPGKESGSGLSPKRPKPVVPEPQGEYGSFDGIDPIYLFGEPEEIDNRVATGYKASSGTNPAQAPPSFVQIRPGPSGKNANEPSPKNYNGNFKFGNGRRYV